MKSLSVVDVTGRSPVYRLAVMEARRKLYPVIDGAGITSAEFVAMTRAGLTSQHYDERCLFAPCRIRLADY